MHTTEATLQLGGLWSLDRIGEAPAELVRASSGASMMQAPSRNEKSRWAGGLAGADTPQNRPLSGSCHSKSRVAPRAARSLQRARKGIRTHTNGQIRAADISWSLEPRAHTHFVAAQVPPHTTSRRAARVWTVTQQQQCNPKLSRQDSMSCSHSLLSSHKQYQRS